MTRPCLCVLLLVAGTACAEEAPAAEAARASTFSTKVFTGLWLLEESSTVRTTHPTVGASVQWAFSHAWALTGQLRLIYDQQGTEDVLQRTGRGALDVLVERLFPLPRVTLSAGLGASGYLAVGRYGLEGTGATFVLPEWGLLARLSIEAPVTGRLSFFVAALVADRGQLLDGLLLLGVHL